jgi:ParB family transcriptional regulator, chromosome partitioning protein
MLKKSGLGKGLGALIPEPDSGRGRTQGLFCPVDQIRLNPDQPRKRFDEAALAGLAETVREKGILQPLLVRKVGSYFELIAGERRLRAASMAGLKEVPVVLRESVEDDGLELAMIENLQREDLNPIEEARGYREMLQRSNLTQEELARRLGRDRSSLANSVRLLHLPREIQDDLARGELSSGHGRALLAMDREVLQLQIRSLIKEKGLSVRETEKIVLKYKEGKENGRTGRPDTPDPDMKRLEDELRRRFGAPVTIRQGRRGGKIQIPYASAEDLDRILSLMISERPGI